MRNYKIEPNLVGKVESNKNIIWPGVDFALMKCETR